jgi:outer membrane protein assembly factor BamC
VNRSPAVNPARLSVLALAVALCGCSTLQNVFSNDKVDYRQSGSNTGKPLEVPPDLSQLARDNRYQAQGGVISAAATPGAAAPAAAESVAVVSKGDVKVERDGDERWLVVPQTPEQLWPQIKTFWQERGLPVAHEDKTAGVMETDWVENHVKLPQGIIRNTLGRALETFYDTGERDKYITRIERAPGGGSEVYVSHRGMQEVYTDERKETTRWTVRPREPQLEIEMLSQLMTRLGTKPAVAHAAVASAPEQPAHAHAIGDPPQAVEVDEPFDRAWRRVGLALDRGGFTVEDRDRSGGLYYVRYINPKFAGKDEPGWWSKLFGGDKSVATPQRYRIAVKSSNGKTTVTVLNSDGSAGTGDNGRLITEQLLKELR